MTEPIDLDAIRRRAEAAHAEIAGLREGTRRWTTRVPVAQDPRDSDLVLIAAVRDVDVLVAEVERLRAEVMLLTDTDDARVVAAEAEVERLRAERERDRRIVDLAKLWRTGNGARNHPERLAQLNALMDAVDASITGEDF